MRVRRIPLEEVGVALSTGWDLIEFFRLGTVVFAIVAKRDESAEVIRG